MGKMSTSIKVINEILTCKTSPNELHSLEGTRKKGVLQSIFR